MNIPISSTQDYIDYLAKKGVECPKCLEVKHDSADVEWIHEFMECLRCDSLHNDEIEEATSE